jgi:hypothetical protein
MTTWGWAITCDDRLIGTVFTTEPSAELALEELAAQVGTYPWDWQQCRDGWPVANLIGDDDV